MSVLSTVKDEPIKIVDIAPARLVDDDADEDQVVQVREFNVITNGSRMELSIDHVFEVEPRFLPGTRVGSRRIQNVQLAQTESDAVYTLTAEFIRETHKTPFLIPIEWEWESTTLELPAYVDNDGRPIVTTAGEPITGLTRKLKLWTIRGTRNVPGVPKWFRDYGESVNSDNVKIDGETFKPKELQLTRLSLGSWETQTIDKKEYRFRPLSFEFVFNPLTWTTEVANLGFIELIRFERKARDEDGEIISGKTVTDIVPVRALTEDGDETPHRVFLNKNGQRPRTEDGEVRTDLKPKDIVTLKFNLDEELPYKRLLT